MEADLSDGTAVFRRAPVLQAQSKVGGGDTYKITSDNRTRSIKKNKKI